MFNMSSFFYSSGSCWKLKCIKLSQIIKQTEWCIWWPVKDYNSLSQLNKKTHNYLLPQHAKTNHFASVTPSGIQDFDNSYTDRLPLLIMGRRHLCMSVWEAIVMCCFLNKCNKVTTELRLEAKHLQGWNTISLTSSYGACNNKESCQTHRSKIAPRCWAGLRSDECEGHSIWFTLFLHSSSHPVIPLSLGWGWSYPGGDCLLKQRDVLSWDKGDQSEWLCII